MSAPDIYAKQLSKKNLGFPLWQPDPGQNPAVEIADVGYMLRGAFIRLFNASKDRNDHANSALGVPSPYVPISVGPIQRDSPLPVGPIRSESVSGRSIGLDVAGGLPPLAQASGSLSFRCEDQEGAILILGDFAYRQEALSKKRFLDYIREYHQSWLTFANNSENARGIAIDDLTFVTGCAKTSKWACAAFSDKSRDSSISFRAGADIATSSLVWGKWEETHSVDKHSGPQRLIPPEQQPPQITITSPQQEASGGNDAMTNDTSQTQYNQCVFARGYRICDRKTFIMRKVGLSTKVQGGIDYVLPNLILGSKEENPSRDSGGDSRPVSGAETESKDGGTECANMPSVILSESEELSGWIVSTDKEQIDTPKQEEIDPFLQLNYDRDPSLLDILLYYILEISSAHLAIVHDDDLTPFLQEHANVNNFGSWLRKRSPEVHMDNQVGMLEVTYQVFLSGQKPSNEPSKADIEDVPDAFTIEYDLRDLTGQVEVIGGYPTACGRHADLFLGEWNNSKENPKVIVRVLRRNSTPKMHERQLRFLREWYSFRHPNVLPLYGLCRNLSSQSPATISPMLYGTVIKYLGDLESKGRSCSLLGRLNLLVGVASALDYRQSYLLGGGQLLDRSDFQVHNFTPEIVHCDIRGEKVLISETFEAILGGFGKSRILSEDQEANEEEADGQAEGSLRWMAPELFSSSVVSGNHGFSTMSDVYAFGCLILQIISGKIPWSDIEADASVLLQVTRGKKPPLPNSTYLPVDVRTLTESCWSHDVYARPSMSRATTFLSECVRRVEEETRIPPPYSQDTVASGLQPSHPSHPNVPPPPFSHAQNGINHSKLSHEGCNTLSQRRSETAPCVLDYDPLSLPEAFHPTSSSGEGTSTLSTEQEAKGKLRESSGPFLVDLSTEEFVARMQPIVLLAPVLEMVRKINEICQAMHSNRSEARQLHERCRYILVALQDRSQNAEEKEMTFIVTGCTQRLNHLYCIASKWSSLRHWESFLELESVSKDIEACHALIDNFCKDFEIQPHLKLHHWTDEFQAARKEDYAFRLSALEDISLNEESAIADHQDIPILLKLLQTDLGSLEQDSPRYKALEQALYHIARNSGELLPDIDLKAGEVRRVGDFPVGGSATYDIWEGLWLGREKVAMKVIRGISASPETKKKFLSEVEIWQKFWLMDRGIHVVPFYGTSFEDGPYPSIISPWMENGNVLEYLKDHPTVNRREIIKGIATGLSLLHSLVPKAMPHGDVRAVNILIDDGGQPLLADFGLPRILEDITSVPFTQSKGVSESYRWFAPELFTSPGVISTRSDVFAYAMTVVEIMTERPPFSHLKRTTEVLIGIQKGERPRKPEDFEVLGRGLDDHLWNLLTQCWADSPSDRPTIDEIISRL